MRIRLSGARRADLAALILAVALAVFGAVYHWVEEAGTAERDGFVAQAEMLLAGEIPRDPYRPLLYPLLTAALAGLGVPAFAAARLLSNLAAAALARSAYALGARLDPAGPAGAGVSIAGAWAMALTAVNPNLWILGQHTTTDMSFAAVAAGLLVVVVDYAREPGRHRAVALGALYGAAAFLRGNAVFLLPGVLLSFARGRAPWRRRAWDLALAGSMAGVALLPHLWFRARSFGNPFHDENWKNLAWKLYADGDWSYLDRVPFENLAEIVAHDPGRVARGAFEEALRFAISGSNQLFGTPLHAALALAGLASLVVVGRSRAAGLLATIAALFFVGLALLFFTWGRFLLFAIPLGMAMATAGTAVATARLGGGAVLRRMVSGTLGGAVLLLLVKTAFFQLPAFARRHPTGEVSALTGLATDAPVAGTAPFLGRYLPGPYVALPDAFGPERTEPARYFERIETLLHEKGVRFLAVSEIELRDRPPSLLGSEPPVLWLRPVTSFEGGVVWEVVR